MDNEITALLSKQFTGQDYSAALALLSSLTLHHVMAQSEENLRNTKLAVLHLSKGDLNSIQRYVEAAKKDFRDVIYWATLENNK